MHDEASQVVATVVVVVIVVATTLLLLARRALTARRLGRLAAARGAARRDADPLDLMVVRIVVPGEGSA
jgi:hypothetical protein